MQLLGSWGTFAVTFSLQSRLRIVYQRLRYQLAQRVKRRTPEINKHGTA